MHGEKEGTQWSNSLSVDTFFNKGVMVSVEVVVRCIALVMGIIEKGELL
jgi:hypothetical protein